MPGTHSISLRLYRSSAWLGEDLDRADEALSAHEDRTYIAAVLKAGTCLEGILLKLLKQWQTPVDGVLTLGPLIGALRKTERAPSELLERLNEVNTIRNRAAHDQQTSLNTTTEGDALQILNILALIVEWCSGHTLVSDEVSQDLSVVPVFLSVGRPHRLDQEQFLQRLRADMRALGVGLRSLSSAEYSEAKPFDQIGDLMQSCRAALIVGLERSHAYTVFERERSDLEKIHQDQYVPTAWNQIEGSIASALKLPLLILRERSLQREGIFEAESHRHRIRDFDITTESRGLSGDLREFLAGWILSLQH